ncbi:polysaccharide deacetylase family protein [Halorubrum sp. CBA1125]|uniref:polysaccharide deacetylase family protein n=1 Tax=Halorubrum sp. CBA1125 TaxID=2668072 RepID=UPI001E322FA1|nr:polysaccharide deacetylase family protein [Halorubrum sp. CBA1125]
MGTRDQAYLDRTEVEVAIEYAEIAAEYDVPVTLFLTGRTAVEEPERVETLAAMDNVEIGGHNYWAFDTPVHKTWRGAEKVTGGRIGSWNGPRPFQRFEIRRTIQALNERGVDVTAWRDHAYRHDQYTTELLAEEGITHFSDAVGPDERVRQEDGVTVVPVNTPPDHEHVYHAFRTPGSEAVEEFEGPFGERSVSVDEWVEWVLEKTESVQLDEGVATVLAHPACLWLADEFDAFERLVVAVSDGQARMMPESANRTIHV